MTLPTYHLGDVVLLSVNFTNEAGRAADPETVGLELRDTHGNAQAYVFGTGIEITRTTSPRTGYYEARVVPTSDGLWTYQWPSTGDPTTSEGGTFYVLPSPVGS